MQYPAVSATIRAVRWVTFTSVEFSAGDDLGHGEHVPGVFKRDVPASFRGVERRDNREECLRGMGRGRERYESRLFSADLGQLTSQPVSRNALAFRAAVPH
jgi:hypothetical protein